MCRAVVAGWKLYDGCRAIKIEDANAACPDLEAAVAGIKRLKEENQPTGSPSS